ncbi:hypothetical protein SAMN06298216_0739 [Spirosomataceae bacterium TFI 002]|nr:hypothetical protein SAMN06298216_0739 [Spirosomataceae bacterium TFI 002]
MKLSVVKTQLNKLNQIGFKLPNNEMVPEHFHVTEVGKITKNFIDCGGKIRKEEVVNFQLWNANDYNHRLHPEKLLHIIELSEKALEIGDLEVEVEYQAGTIGKFGLDFDGENFLLTNKQTDCLAQDSCGIPADKLNISIKEAAACTPGSGCC